MKKFIISLLIFLVSTFFINDVNAYYEDNRYLYIDLSTVTKENLKFSDSDSSYYDDLIKIDNYMKTTGYHYTIYLLKSNSYSTNYDRIFIYVNGLYDSGYIYNKISYKYSSSYNNYAPIGVSTNLNSFNYTTYNDNSFTVINRNNPSAITNSSSMSEFLSQIDQGIYPFAIGSEASESNKYSYYGNEYSSNDSVIDNCFLGDNIKIRIGNPGIFPFSSSDDIYYFDLDSFAYPIAFISPGNTDSYVVNRGDKMPLLINYFEPKFNYTYRESFNSNSSDTNGVITQIIQEHPSVMTGEANYNYSTKIELIPNDPTNPIVPDLVSATLYYCPASKNCKTIDEAYPGYTQSDFMNYEVKSELGIKSLYVYFNNIIAVGGYKVVYTFTDSDNVTFNIYDSRVETDVDDPLYYYPVSSYFENYKKVVFDKEHTHLFLSSKNNKDFKIYIPTYSLSYDNELISVGNFNYTNGSISYLNGTEFSFNSYYTEFNLTVDHSIQTVGYLSKNNGEVTIYVPEDIYTSFYDVYTASTGGDDKIEVSTPDGVIIIDTVIPPNAEVNSWLGYVNNYLNGATDTINYVKKVVQAFFDDMPVWLNTFFVLAWIFLNLKITIVLGGWK